MVVDVEVMVVTGEVVVGEAESEHAADTRPTDRDSATARHIRLTFAPYDGC